jgi:hypothetical protein
MNIATKPNDPPIIALTSAGVAVLSPPPNDTDVVIAGTPLQFRLNLSVTGFLPVVALYLNQPVQVIHSVEQVQTGIRFRLGPFAFTTPGTIPAIANFDLTTGPFTTSLNGGGGRFETAPGDEDGVYRVVTEFHFTVNAAAAANSAFDDRILAITAP